MIDSRSRRVCAGGCPAVGAGIVPPAGVKNGGIAVCSAPHDHFAAGPDCSVTASAAGALVVLVGVQLSVLGLYLPPLLKMPRSYPAPHDHFAAGPDCRVSPSDRRLVVDVGCSPRVIDAATRGISYYRKLVGDIVLASACDRRCALKGADGSAIRPLPLATSRCSLTSRSRGGVWQDTPR